MKIQPTEREVAKLLKRFFSEIETFEERGLDSLDFKEVNVATIKDAIGAAFAAGRDFEGLRRDRRDERDARGVR